MKGPAQGLLEIARAPNHRDHAAGHPIAGARAAAKHLRAQWRGTQARKAEPAPVETSVPTVRLTLALSRFPLL